MLFLKNRFLTKNKLFEFTWYGFDKNDPDEGIIFIEDIAKNYRETVRYVSGP